MGPGLRRDGEQGKSRIVTMFAEANWITASFAGVTEVLVPALVRCRPMSRMTWLEHWLRRQRSGLFGSSRLTGRSRWQTAERDIRMSSKDQLKRAVCETIDRH